jgi:uncharacterized protein
MAKYYNNNPLIGRESEYKKMQDFLTTKESELLAVIGRRRVGKTFLIKKVYENEMVFHITGIQDFNKKLQLQNFVEARNEFFPESEPFAIPSNWLSAFSQLKQLLGNLKKKKRVLFFDELPWLASGSAEFLRAFDHFWNSWAIDQNLVVVICGSSASWMITNIINHKGGLHNRVTQRINLQPFTLQETEKYFVSKSMSMPRQNVVQLYMTTGGIPYYLKEIQRGETAVQSINNIFFGKAAPLFGEFDNLYKALFSNYEKHIAVIRALATKWSGLTREEIIEKSKLNTGGAISTILEELETSSFIQSYTPYRKKQRQTLYRLTDEYSLFYLHFIEPNKNIKDFWLKKFNTPTAKSWGGYAFETLCMKHINGIKQVLGISGILTTESSFYKRKDSETAGCQIDTLIERADNAINICEMKYYDGLYSLTNEDIQNLQKKRNVFQQSTKTQKQLFTTLITSQGLEPNNNSYLIDKQLDANALFLCEHF